ncbi:MAG: DinB/UmuC family translesion DNA polymerase, partial [Bordetella sp.]|uniref:DinB/UmuC family translesion DNA polymerase n=1 Tax=Bordetella sp. TaxID=28081 RepID=UPI003F7B3A65
HTVGELGRHTAAELELHFGRYGYRLYELARGIDDRPVEPDQAVRQVSAETTFEIDLRLDQLDEALERLANKAWEQTRKKGLAARTVVLKLKTDRFRILTRSHTQPQAVASAQELAQWVLGMRERVTLPPYTLYRLAGVGLSNFIEEVGAGQQADLF